MRIKVTTDVYEYQGLMCGSEHEVTRLGIETGLVQLVSNGKTWTLGKGDYVVQEDLKIEGSCGNVTEKGPIKSDGGSSSYYDLPVSEWLLYTLIERQKEGKCYIKTEEMISAFFNNDFDRGNLLKSLVRCQGLQDGTGGKVGNSVEYECNKMIYSVNKIKEKK